MNKKDATLVQSEVDFSLRRSSGFEGFNPVRISVTDRRQYPYYVSLFTPMAHPVGHSQALELLSMIMFNSTVWCRV